MIVPRLTWRRRPCGLRTHPIARGNIPEQHLRTFRGALQADAYAGFNQLYKEDGCRILEVVLLGARAA